MTLFNELYLYFVIRITHIELNSQYDKWPMHDSWTTLVKYDKWPMHDSWTTLVKYDKWPMHDSWTTLVKYLL